MDNVSATYDATNGLATQHPIRIIAFDLDSTLVDIIRLKSRAAEAAAWALADAGLDIDPTVSADDILAVGFEIGIDSDEIIQTFLRRKGVLDDRLHRHGQAAFDDAEARHVIPYPRVHATLWELTRRGYGLLLITDAPRQRAVRRLEAARLSPYFRDIITGDDTPNGKADTRPYAMAADLLSVHPQEILMVGDNPHRDIGVAREFGCRTILARYGLQPDFASSDPAHRAHAEIDWFDELLHHAPPLECTPQQIHASSNTQMVKGERDHFHSGRSSLLETG